MQSIIQDVVKLVLKSDLDRDGYLNNKERDILGKRLSISMELYGIVFDIDKFLLAVERHPSISGALTIVRHLLPIDDNDKKRLLVSSFRDSININFDNVDNANSKSMEDDVYDMFYTPISDDVHRGDAHSIGMCKEYHARNNGQLPLLISISPTMSNSILGLRCSVSSGVVKHHLISTPKVIMNSHHHHHHHFLQHHSPSRCRRNLWKVLREAVISGRVTKISAMTSSKMIPSSNDLEKTAVLIGNKNKLDPWDEESQ